MSSVDAPPEIEQKTNPVEAQEISGEVKQMSDAELKAAARKAIEEAFVVTEAWQPKKVVRFVIEFASGQKALVKHLDQMDLIRAKLIEDMDSFTKNLFPESIDPAGNPVERKTVEESIWEILGDAQRRARFLDMTNRLMAISSVRPKIINDGVALIKDDDDEDTDVFGYQVKEIDKQIELFGKPVPPLKKNEAYAGTIDFQDRFTFFMQLNQPLELISPFRNEPNAVLASLEPVQSFGLPTERPS